MPHKHGDTYLTEDIRQSMARVRELLRHHTNDRVQKLTVDKDDLRHLFHMAEVGCRRYGITNPQP